MSIKIALTKVVAILVIAGISSSLLQAKTNSNKNTIPTLHAILVIVDDYDDPASNAIAASVKRDYGTVSKFLQILSSRNIVKLNKQTLMGKNATKQQVMNALNTIQADDNDILLFYFSGHGGLFRGSDNAVFTREGESIERQTIENIFSGSNARLKMIISDACSNSVDGVAVIRGFVGANNASNGKFDAIYKKLFYEYEGMFSASASSPGEYAWSDDAMGGYFTHFFFKEMLITAPKSEWSTMFETAKNKTRQMFNLLDASYRRELAKDGVTSQTPISYHLPYESGGTEIIEVVEVDKITISISNTTNQPIVINLDYNQDVDNWKTELYEEKKIQPGAVIQLDKDAVIGFYNGNEIIYYQLANGNFSFSQTEGMLIDLYEDDTQPANTSSVNELLKGNWNWELTDASYTITYNDDYSYSIITTNSEIIETGNWSTKTIDEGYNTPILSFEYIEGGETYLQDYEVNILDEQSIQLLLQDFKIGNETYTGDQFEDEISNIMLYKL